MKMRMALWPDIGDLVLLESEFYKFESQHTSVWFEGVVESLWILNALPLCHGLPHNGAGRSVPVCTKPVRRGEPSAKHMFSVKGWFGVERRTHSVAIVTIKVFG